MEKVQVRIELQAPERGAPLGSTICALFSAVEGDSQRWRLYTVSPLGWQQVREFEWPSGALTAHDADVLALELGDAMYDWIVNYVGIQELLPHFSD